MPVGAFVTFESEEGINRCLKAAEKKSPVRILGEPLQAQAATEPTNIIWENREVTPLSRMFRLLLVVITVMVIFLVFFGVIVYLK